jgi:hypothetical protein
VCFLISDDYFSAYTLTNFYKKCMWAAKNTLKVHRARIPASINISKAVYSTWKIKKVCKLFEQPLSDTTQICLHVWACTNMYCTNNTGRALFWHANSDSMKGTKVCLVWQMLLFSQLYVPRCCNLKSCVHDWARQSQKLTT